MRIKYLIIFLITLLLSCGAFKPYLEKRTLYGMDTVVNVTLVVDSDVASDEEKAKKYVDETWLELQKLLDNWGERFSQTHQKSEMKALNSSKEPVQKVSDDLFDMLQIAQKWGDTISGKFDITTLPIKNLWGMGEKSRRKYIPSQKEIDSVLSHVDYKKIALLKSDRAVKILDTSLVIDIGGIAKGYFLKKAGILLEKRGFKNYLIVAGGDILAKGVKPENKQWHIAVKHPRKKGFITTMPLAKGSIVTSGDYERYFIRDGKRYHHIFDPQTGYPSTKNQSVTIWGPDPVTVDVLSTGLFCFSADSAIAFIDGLMEYESLIVDSMGGVHLSQGWKQMTIKE